MKQNAASRPTATVRPASSAGTATGDVGAGSPRPSPAGLPPSSGPAAWRPAHRRCIQPLRLSSSSCAARPRWRSGSSAAPALLVVGALLAAPASARPSSHRHRAGRPAACRHGARCPRGWPAHRPRASRPVVAQAIGQRAKRARHGRGIDHRQHRHAKVPGQVGRAGAAVKQAHHAFDEYQVRLARRIVQALRAVGPRRSSTGRAGARAPLASWCQCGSRKSGPHGTRARAAPGACRRARAAVTVFLPCPEAGAAISSAAQGHTAPSADIHPAVDDTGAPKVPPWNAPPGPDGFRGRRAPQGASLRCPLHTDVHRAACGGVGAASW